MTERARRITEVYVVHHSHTDIGYTDLQERVLYNHIDYIKSAVAIIKKGYERDTVERGFKWNCETYLPVELFLANSTPEEQADFFELVSRGNIGLSATYLNFNDLVDKTVLTKRTARMVDLFGKRGIAVPAAMNADVNGISLGARDAFIDCGVAFLFMNIHTHHGMYPLYKNQTAFRWQRGDGKELLVFSGEHYNMGNALGLVENINHKTVGNVWDASRERDDPIEVLKENLDRACRRYTESGYPYPFLVTSVSGVFSDNAPPNPEIIHTIAAFNARYGEQVRLRMVTVEELYRLIAPHVADAPVCHGDLTDWWANGIGTTPQAVKHYKEAQRLYHTCLALNERVGILTEDHLRAAEDNLLLYAEHTWGHSATIEDPYDTMVGNLDIRKASYASKAHEASAANHNVLIHALGDRLRYYDYEGTIAVVNAGGESGPVPVTFYIEAMEIPPTRIVAEATGEEVPCQRSPHPRGVLITFVDRFAAGEERRYRYETACERGEPANNYFAHVGSEGVKDIVNRYDTTAYNLPYALENAYFRLEYAVGSGITSLYDKVAKRELTGCGVAPLFTPIYERSEIRKGAYDERRSIGRNIRAVHAELSIGTLTDVIVEENGAVFTRVRLEFALPGTQRNAVVVTLYHALPRLDVTYRVAKDLSLEIEGLFLPLSPALPSHEVYLDKGDVPMRPGIDQIPGSCMEYYALDNGLVYKDTTDAGRDYLFSCPDTPLVYAGAMHHHPIRLCENDPADNRRPLYSWIMNSTWETNFTLRLAGFHEFRYSFESVPSRPVEKQFATLKDRTRAITTFIRA